MKFLALSPLLLSLAANAATRFAVSPALNDVATVVNMSANGDEIVIPAGNATWTNTLVVPRSISFVGAGTNATLITVNVPNPGGEVNICGLDLEGLTNSVSGITFSGVAPFGANPAVYWNSWDGRITSCVFTNCRTGVIATGFGVLDHSLLINCHISARAFGASCFNWANLYPVPFNSTNYLFVENNQLVHDNSFDSVNYGTDHAWMSSGQGSIYCFRFNTLRWSKGQFAPCFDWHGDQPGDPSRGNLSAQVYGNNFFMTGTATIAKFCDARGGQSHVFSNTISSTMLINTYIQYREEHPPPNGTIMCGNIWYDAVTNSCNWANTQNGGSPIVGFGDAWIIEGQAFSNAPPSVLVTPPYPHALDNGGTPLPPGIQPPKIHGQIARVGAIGLP